MVSLHSDVLRKKGRQVVRQLQRLLVCAFLCFPFS